MGAEFTRFCVIENKVGNVFFGVGYCSDYYYRSASDRVFYCMIYYQAGIVWSK